MFDSPRRVPLHFHVSIQLMGEVMRVAVRILALVCVAICMACSAPTETTGTAGQTKTVVRVGHFPNVTHAQALIAHALTRQGQGWFESRLGPVEIQWHVYNAGPSAMEAFFAESLDLAYVGPNPVLNAHIKSKGEEVRIIAGSATGGSALVVHGNGSIKTPQDFRGRRVGTPQLGNTQDVSCRAWLVAQGYQVTQLGGDVTVLPTSNPDQLSLFKTRDLDAVWTVEPWVSLLEMEAGGVVYLEEPDALTTVLAARTGFLDTHRELAGKFAAAHAELTRWVLSNPEEARRLVAAELKEETSRAISPDRLERSWRRLRFTSEISLDAIETFVAAARSAGFLSEQPDLSRLVEPPR